MSFRLLMTSTRAFLQCICVIGPSSGPRSQPACIATWQQWACMQLHFWSCTRFSTLSYPNFDPSYLPTPTYVHRAISSTAFVLLPTTNSAAALSHASPKSAPKDCGFVENATTAVTLEHRHRRTAASPAVKPPQIDIARRSMSNEPTPASCRCWMQP